ncbi:pilus assembly protein TadG-related protein [Streptomyces chrestomyceticus]|uniref:pilus assembly protein TadG-related protein n=1 Tax=Streptomyces chrestomyceticus TaxID=68185 RepID=UPI0033F2E68E
MTRAASRRRTGDAGQAFPLYIVAVAGLLLLAFAFFAVGQAAATRNSAQTAADAAALAAGQKYRDQLSTELLDAIRTGEPWKDLLGGRGVPGAEACANAQRFAGRNDADATCTAGSYPTSFAVEADTRKTVGRSVIPGTENTHASARARAVVEPRCTPGPEPEPTPTPAPGEGGDGPGQGDGDDPPADDPPGGDPPANNPPAGPPTVNLTCQDGKEWTVDPADPRDLPEAADLFSVRLAE